MGGIVADLTMLLPLLSGPLQARQAGRVKPRRGGAHDARRFRKAHGGAARKFLACLRTRSAAKGVPSGVCFFGYFLCTSKESDSRESAKSFNYQITGDNSGLREKRPQPLEAASIPQAGEGRKEMR